MIHMIQELFGQTLRLILSDESEVALQMRGLFEQYHEECGA